MPDTGRGTGTKEQLEVLLREGRSLSGREKNVVMVNTGGEGRRFADVSAVSGFDVDGDGRGVALTDWDADGDLDVWVSNRTAPTVQFFENRWGADAGESLQLDLVGRDCNRDAIGARVEVLTGTGERLVKTVRAGSGFQSQSGKRLHFGLGSGGVVKGVSVRWPGSDRPETFAGIGAGGFFRLGQGSGAAVAVRPAAGAVAGRHEGREERRVEDDEVTVLPHRTVFPELTWTGPDGEEASYDGGEPLLLLLWQPECDRCREELAEIGEAPLGVRCVALTGDPAALAVAGPGFQHEVGVVGDGVIDRILELHRHLFYRPYHLQVPVAFLIDRAGELAVVYREGIPPGRIADDLELLDLEGDALASRAGFFRGRWAGAPVGDRPAVLIKSYLGRGMADEAERVFRARAGHVTVRDQGGEIARAIGEGYLFLGQLDPAERLLFEALGSEPEQPRVLNNLGALKLAQGDAAEAKRFWSRAREADLTYAAPRLNLGKQLMKEEETAEAIDVLLEYVGLEEMDADGYHYLAIGHLRNRNWEKAVTVLRRLLELRPGDRAARENLAKVYLTLGKRDEAARVMRGN